MKRYALAFGLILTSLGLKADITLTERLERPMYVVLSDNNLEINREIRSAIDNYWSLSTVEYISESEYEPLSWTAESCFLIYQKNQSVEDDGNVIYSEVIRVVSFTKKGKLVQHIAGTPVMNSGTADHQQDLVNSVRILQDKVRFELYREQGETEFSSYSEKISESHGIVKLKKLYISAQDLEEGMDYASIMDIYEGDVRIVDRSYIDELIDRKLQKFRILAPKPSWTPNQVPFCIKTLPRQPVLKGLVKEILRNWQIEG
jgi:hypothetical protein